MTLTDRLGATEWPSTGAGSVPFFFPSSLLPAPLNTCNPKSYLISKFVKVLKLFWETTLREITHTLNEESVSMWSWKHQVLSMNFTQNEMRFIMFCTNNLNVLKLWLSLREKKMSEEEMKLDSDGRTHHFCWCHLLITLGLPLEFRFFVPNGRGKVHLQYSKTVTGNSKLSWLIQVFLLMYQGIVKIQIVPANISSWSTFRIMFNRLIDWLIG